MKKVDLFELEEGQSGSNGHGDDWDVNEQHESFTVNLGNQLKITQNIRLVRCNIQGMACNFPRSFEVSNGKL